MPYHRVALRYQLNKTLADTDPYLRWLKKSNVSADQLNKTLADTDPYLRWLKQSNVSADEDLFAEEYHSSSEIDTLEDFIESTNTEKFQNQSVAPK
ncbi:hypothetical protein T484DRAFT_1837589 [Baffinella frigidus]|nr:hypothetical protein T484DRAFT_1837589 [Cryptophyta sp. CCMP2293]